jgi:hypothetical protein
LCRVWAAVRLGGTPASAAGWRWLLSSVFAAGTSVEATLERAKLDEGIRKGVRNVGGRLVVSMSRAPAAAFHSERPRFRASMLVVRALTTGRIVARNRFPSESMSFMIIATREINVG